ncbi:hypothetical protein PILCRDRAFT_5587 [Piloderma croceum F 1598]|uniref:Amidase domain-containing protein n=1 Tax=Piloderma croceum (strain F 1598) TaxID=765440 RepID=A0A0C3BG36_PILCF|nr:hypothetical protein PILCRDRAFT_5587 [Piloderma croceum F 1598]
MNSSQRKNEDNFGPYQRNWKPLKHRELNYIWSAGSAEDYRTVTASTEEPVIQSMLPGVTSSNTAFVASIGDGVTAYQLWQLQKKTRDIRSEYPVDHWESTVQISGTGRPVDAIISPVAPYAAPPHGKNRYTAYTVVWNGLDHAAASFPVSTVDPAIDVNKPPHEFLSKADKPTTYVYNPAIFKGAPVGLQLVRQTLEEEAVIAMTEIVDAAIKELRGSEGTLPNLKTALVEVTPLY